MGALAADKANERLAAGDALDRLWGETMGLPDNDSKERSLGGGPRPRVARFTELIGLKLLLAAEEPRWRRREREHDLADVATRV